MSIELVHVGFDNYLAANRVVAVASLNSASMRRLIKGAQNNGLLIDMTHGRKTRAAIITDTNHVFLSSRAPEIISGRLQASRAEDDPGRGISTPRLEQSDEKGSSQQSADV